jgi:protein disulfide-isomerase
MNLSRTIVTKLCLSLGMTSIALVATTINAQEVNRLNHVSSTVQLQSSQANAGHANALQANALQANALHANAGQVDANQPWVESYDEALQRSKATGRPVMLVFSGSDWCGWCVKLKKNVFAKSEFKQWASQNVLMVEVDFPRTKQLAARIQQQNSRLKTKYGQHVNSYPTILIVDSTGATVAKTGYDGLGAESFINTASSLIGTASKSNKLASAK